MEKLLASPDPAVALAAISQFWSLRADASKASLGLAKPEFNAHLYLWYSGEVGNGGHSQFFLSPIGAHAEETLSALQSMEFSALAAILQEACALLPNGFVPKDRSRRELAIRALSQQALRRWEALDRSVSQLTFRHDQMALHYLRQHLKEILVPERARRS